MTALAPLQDDVFAANRADGRIALSAAAIGNVTRRGRVHESGSLRVRFPNAESRGALDAVLVNTAGGMAGGDRFDIAMHVGAGARLTVTSAAAEKIYRSLGPDTRVGVTLDVAAGGSLVWLPQETILFDRARLRRSIDITLAPGASLLAAEAVLFGRAAMGETLHSGYFYDRRRVRRDGALVFAETVRLDGDLDRRLAQRAAAGGNLAVAFVLKIPGGEADVAAVRALGAARGEIGASAWNGIAVVRLLAADDAALRCDLAAALAALDGGPLPRLWLN